MNDTDLWDKAAKAGYDYRTVHGCYPDKIGIHYERLRQFGRHQIIFPEITPPEQVNWLALEQASPESITIRQHYTRFEPVIGEHTKRDEVYLPIPNDATGTISGEQLAYLAAEIEREERARVLLGLRMPSDWSDLSR